jgi:hypothetical protein
MSSPALTAISTAEPATASATRGPRKITRAASPYNGVTDDLA